jgi:hypothetical protein
MFQPRNYFVDYEIEFNLWIIVELNFQDQEIITLNWIDPDIQPLNVEAFENRIRIGEERVTVEQMNQNLIEQIQGIGEIIFRIGLLIGQK